jgi:hypothetical protein
VDGGVGEAGRCGGGAEVFGEGLVVEPVGGAAGFGGFDNVGAGVLAEPVQVVVGVGAAGDSGGEGGPDVFPGQALAFGVGQGPEQVAGSGGVGAEPGVEVFAHGVAGQAERGGAPVRVGGVGEVPAAARVVLVIGRPEAGIGGVGDRVRDRPGLLRPGVEVGAVGEASIRLRMV